MAWYDWILNLVGVIFQKKLKLNIKIEKQGPYAEGEYLIYNNEDKDVTLQEYGMITRRKLIINSKSNYPHTTFLILFRIKTLFFIIKIREKLDKEIKSGHHDTININPEEFKESLRLSGKWRFFVKINGKKYYSKKHKKGVHVG